MSTLNVVLDNDWKDVSTGKVSIVLVSGEEFWAFNGLLPPPANTKLRDFIPITGKVGQAAYSYGGTEKTFCRIAGPNKATGDEGSTGRGMRIAISVTPIV